MSFTLTRNVLVMNKVSSSNGFKACPKCLSAVDVVVVRRSDAQDPTSFFFVNCDGCGEGTQTAFSSMEKLQAVWNEYVDQTRGAVAS